MNEISSSSSSKHQIQTQRMLYLVFATATLLILGLIYAWSIFATPIGQSYDELAGLASQKGMFPQVFQVSMFAFCISALFGAQLIKKTSARLTIIVAAFLLAGGFILTALCATMGVWALFVFYGVIAASGCGIAYNAIISLVNPWFPDKIGLCSGIMMMGFGISSLVFGNLANALFKLMDWSIVFVAIAVAGAVVMVALALIVRPAPSDIGRILGLSSLATSSAESPTKNQSVLSSKVFWLFSIWATAVIACGLTLIGTSGQGARYLGLDALFGEGFPALLVGLVSTMNGLGRIINGFLFDRFGLVPVMFISAFTACLCMVGLAFSLSAVIPLLYIVAAILVASPYGSVPVMASAYARQRYKTADFAKNLGIANCNIASAAVINIIIVALLGTPAGENGPIIYGILAALAVLAFVAVFAFKKVYQADLTQIAKELEE